MPKPSIPLATVEQLLQKEWGSFSDIAPLEGGLTAQAFSFRFDDAECVIRLSHSLYSFQKDAFVSDRFASSSLPIPKVLKLGNLDADTYFCISRRASGVRLQDLSTSELEGVTDAVVSVMDVISKADLAGTRGVGRFNAQGQAPYQTWSDFLLTVTDAEVFAWTNTTEKVDKRVVARATSIIKENVSAYPELRCLLHGDFGSYNVLSDGEHITGVIDWDLSLFGDPLYEVANLLFWREERLLPVIRRLEKEVENLPQWQERVLCYQLHIGLNEIYYERYNIAWLTNRCKDIMG